MRIPESLQSLKDNGVIDGVERQLKSGKEASVFIVSRGDEQVCAKVYKQAEQRGFHKLAEYQEGRRSRGGRDERAMGRRSKRGRALQEEQWKSAEVDALYRLRDAGVCVPQPLGYFDGVLLMELVRDEQGFPAPRLGELTLDADTAREWHQRLIGDVVRMLCAGLIHGDLSEYNILVGADGPVIIDLPQAVDASSNNNAFRMLARDVNNLRSTFGQFAPELLQTEYAYEIWKLFQCAELTPDAALTGVFEHDQSVTDVDAILAVIEDARREAEIRQAGREAAAEQDD